MCLKISDNCLKRSVLKGMLLSEFSLEWEKNLLSADYFEIEWNSTVVLK